jgi:hypothetical protein
MRYFTLLLLLCALAPVALSQTSEEFRQKYGKPTVETFSVQPKIVLTVGYTADDQPCQIVLEPPHSIIPSTDERFDSMPTDAITKLMEDLSPPSQRGKLVQAYVTKSGCNSYDVREYERVKITRSQGNCEPASPDRDFQLVITFTQRACR